MCAGNHMKEAKRLYQKAVEEFNRAKERNDGTILRDACGKGWLSTIEAAYALLIQRGVKEEQLPQTDRGRRYMVNKYFDRGLRRFYLSLRESLHIEGYYNGALDFNEAEICLDELNIYLQKIEGL